MTASTKMRAHVTGAVLAALGLRIYFVWRFSFYDAGDTPIYQQLAHNWLKHGIYGLDILGHVTAVDMRTPGYPAFLAMIESVFGESARAGMVTQAFVDTLTCVLIAAMAAVLAPRESRGRVALAALWLAALGPFTANYTAVVLTETLTIFLSALALLVLMEALRGLRRHEQVVSPGEMSPNMRWLMGGCVVGFGTLVRPEAPLILAAAGAVVVGCCWRPKNWTKLVRAGLLMAVGLAMPLMPWAARNWRTLHTVQFLSPRYSELPGEFTPHGFYAWTGTWLWRFGDVFLVSWNVDGAEINIAKLRASGRRGIRCEPMCACHFCGRWRCGSHRASRCCPFRAICGRFTIGGRIASRSIAFRWDFFCWALRTRGWRWRECGAYETIRRRCCWWHIL